MSGRRRVQRSVRLVVASGLLAAAAAVVLPTVITGTGVAVAAVVALLVGVVAARIVYSEVVQTRAEAAQDKARQARGFEVALTKNLVEHAEFTALMSRHLQERDRVISELHGTLRIAERRADDAEARVLREARRANETQRRLSALLDEVAAHQAALEAEAVATGQLAELPTIVDLLAWEEKVTATASTSQETRREA